MHSQLNPYISFKDNAREAMEFYRTVFGGKLNVHTFSEYHASHDPSEDDKIMHAMLTADNGLTLMGADTMGQMGFTPGGRISLSLSGMDAAELSGYFEKLSAGGSVSTPLEKAQWGDTFGMLTDKYGVVWMVNIFGGNGPAA
jgi:PhnB protein